MEIFKFLEYEWDYEKPDPLYIRAIYAVMEVVRVSLNKMCSLARSGKD